jgi:hypothetical protein
MYMSQCQPFHPAIACLDDRVVQQIPHEKSRYLSKIPLRAQAHSTGHPRLNNMVDYVFFFNGKERQHERIFIPLHRLASRAGLQYPQQAHR